MKGILNWVNANPKKLFLIDGFGAIISIIMLGFVLVRLESLFGIPKSMLYFLASLPLFFAVYDFYCYFKNNGNLTQLLRIIGIINICYCFLSIVLAIYNREVITNYGWTYLLLEMLLVSVLAIIELIIAQRQVELKNTNSLIKK